MPNIKEKWNSEAQKIMTNLDLIFNIYRLSLIVTWLNNFKTLIQLPKVQTKGISSYLYVFKST